MEEGFYDRSGNFVPGRRIGTEYELEPHDRAAVEDIKKQLKKGRLDNEKLLECMEFLENLNRKLSDAIRNEAAAGNDNWTLKASRDEVVELYSRLRQEKARLEG
ncbi:hypothetical protein HY640_02130 [Candidatus Woesearchaeota archaeon]|nr:hypothetical protein [Candidatus Woesearchaeota archaeon]